jgi:CRP-like cAMP-binding protein
MPRLTAPGDLFIFRDVSSRAVTELCILAPPVNLGAGAKVFEQGSTSDIALLLTAGKLSVEVQHDGDSRTVGQVHPGEIVGEQALFSRGGSRSATVRAIEESQALIIDWSLLERAADNPAMIAIERHLLATMARRIRATNSAIQKLWKETGTLEAPTDNRRFAKGLRSLFSRGRSGTTP